MTNSTYHGSMHEGPIGAPVIRVLIADHIARIVHDLEVLSAFAGEVDVCGIARRSADVVSETRLRQPDVLVLHEDFEGRDAADVIRELATATPRTRVVLITTAPAAGDGVAAPRAGVSATV